MAELPASTIRRAPRGLRIREVGDRLRAHLRVPLHRDGYALGLNSAFTAATGLLYWMLAAHTYSPHSVGINSALISSMMFLAGIASLNLPNVLVRFLPHSGSRVRRRVIWSYGVSLLLAACAAVAFIIGVGAWAPRLSFLRAEGGLQVWFAFSTLAWCLFMIQDSVLTALGRAIWVPAENAVFSLLKLALLAVLAAALPVYGIFVSWTIAMLVSVAGVNIVIFAALLRRRSASQEAPRLSMSDRSFARYFAADYACSVSWLATANLMPVVVTTVAGATTNAYYALAYVVVIPVYLFAQNIGTALMLHGPDGAEGLPALTRRAAWQGLRVLVPGALILALTAPYLLSLFGHSYAAHSATVLRLLALGTLPYFVLNLALSVARVTRRMRRAVVALGLQAGLALGLAVPLLHVFGVTGAGLAWLAALMLVAAGLLVTWRRSLVDRAPGAPALATPDAPRTPAPVLRPAPSPKADPLLQGAAEMHPRLRELFTAWERRGLGWTLLRAPANPAAPTGDVDILVAPDDAEALRDLAASLGFVALPGWDSGPELMLVGHDAPSGHWLLIDTCTAVTFRSPPRWRLPGAAEQVLARRCATGPAVLPADGDAFWLLLLHCLLDKGSLPEHYRPRLVALAASGRESPLGAAIAAAAGAQVSPAALQAAAEAEQWEVLADLGQALAGELKRRRTLPDRALAFFRVLGRALRKPLLVRRRRGLSIALLGPNGVGKSTAAAELQRIFPFESRVLYMGLWKAANGNDDRGRTATLLEIASRPLRLWSRYLLAQYHQLRGRLVIFDRYVYEALLPPAPPLVRLKRVYYWHLVHLVPHPAAVVVLDAPGHVTYARKQENPPHELDSERRLYAGLDGRIPSFELIDAAAPARVVHAEISELVWRRLAQRWRGSPIS